MVRVLQRRFGLQYSDIVLALFVVAIAAMLLIPLPTLLLDLLLVVNISFALLLLMVGLYMPNALALLSFPSLLLLTTLFRLGLNVASTRLILSQGHAGDVIQAFGTFLIRGEIIVGVLIFTIITIVNFIVIARGSSRVSEVAARFALDALPGKQMAIDSDMRAGLVSPREAEQKREELRKESQLFGSMDGAMKFVQGDAIAGFFIIIVNIVGGLYLGISNGLSFADAVQTYTTLTVGDGLVSQVPALLISICAGIVVTRVASHDQSTLGSDVGAQVFKRSGSVLFAGALLVLIGFFPGLPTVPFIMVGLLFLGIGFMISRKPSGTHALVPVSGSESALMITGGEQSLEKPSLHRDAGLVVHLDRILYRVYDQNAVHYRRWWSEMQDDFFERIGIRLPELVVLPEESLATLHCSVLINRTEAFRERALLDSVMVEAHPQNADMLGLDIIQEDEHPVTSHRVFWAPHSQATSRVITAGGLRIYDWMELLCVKVARFYQKHPEEVLSMSDVLTRLKDVEKRYPGLISEAFNTDFLDTSRLTEILHELVRQGLSIQNFRSIIEALASYCSSYGSSLVQSNEFDLTDIIGYVRLQRRRQLLSGQLSDRMSLRVVVLDDPVEEVILDAPFEGSSLPLAVDRQVFQRLVDGLDALMEPVQLSGILPVSILCRSEIRHKVSAFLRDCASPLSVISEDELEPNLVVEPVGVWELA